MDVDAGRTGDRGIEHDQPVGYGVHGCRQGRHFDVAGTRRPEFQTGPVLRRWSAPTKTSGAAGKGFRNRDEVVGLPRESSPRWRWAVRCLGEDFDAIDRNGVE